MFSTKRSYKMRVVLVEVVASLLLITTSFSSPLDHDRLKQTYLERCASLDSARFDECVVDLAREEASVCRHAAACVSRGEGGVVFFKRKFFYWIMIFG